MLKRWPPGDCIIFHPWRMAAEVKFSIIGRDVDGNLCCDSVCHLASLIKDYHCLLWYPLCLGVHKIQNDYKHPKLMNALWIWGGKHGDFSLCSFCLVIKNVKVKKKCFVVRLPWSILLGIDIKLKSWLNHCSWEGAGNCRPPVCSSFLAEFMLQKILSGHLCKNIFTKCFNYEQLSSYLRVKISSIFVHLFSHSSKALNTTSSRGVYIMHVKDLSNIKKQKL